MPPQNHEAVIGVLVIIILLTIAAAFIAVLTAHASRKAQLFAREKENLALHYNEQVLKSQVEIQEQTLQQVSRELHDNIGQIASLIKINLFTIDMADQQQALVKIENTRDLTRQLIADLRAVSASLNSDQVMQSGIAGMLEQEAEKLNKTGVYKASFSQNAAIPQLPDDHLLILYRMSQEIINNIIKHSGATHIGISVDNGEKGCIIRFTDDGKGFDVAAARNSGGAGLQNLQKRAAMINAGLMINSDAGRGTVTIISLPAE
jgi:signal transduction histidine kinase